MKKSFFALAIFMVFVVLPFSETLAQYSRNQNIPTPQIRSIRTLSSPIHRERFYLQISGNGFDPSTLSVVVTSTNSSRFWTPTFTIYRYSIRGTIAENFIDQIPLSLDAGEYKVCVRNGYMFNKKESNTVVLRVGSAAVRGAQDSNCAEQYTGNQKNSCNCVYWIRSCKLSNLPYGLETFEGKKKIINTNRPQKGYIAIIEIRFSKEGHTAYVKNIYWENGLEIIEIEEANYYYCKTSTRRGTAEYLHIVGYYNPYR